MASPLVQGVPGLVVLTLADKSYDEAVGDVMVKLDDSYWTRQLRRPFSWQWYTNWWVARRWVQPHDVRLTWFDGGRPKRSSGGGWLWWRGIARSSGRR